MENSINRRKMVMSISMKSYVIYSLSKYPVR